MRTNECTLVALDAVVGVPYGNEACYATLLVGGCALFPSAVLVVLVGADGQVGTILSVDGTHELRDELGFVIDGSLVGWQVSPSRINRQHLVLAAAVNSCKVHVHHVLALLAVRLHDSLLHLLYCKLYGDDLRDAEECALQDGVRAVAEANFLCNLGGVDVIDGDVLLCEVLLYIIRNELHKLFALEDGVQQELTAGAQTANHVVHTQISLNVASNEVRRLNLIGAADGRVAEAQVRASEAARLLRVVAEVSLAVLVGVIANNLDRVLVGTNRTVGTHP